jgi:hypothetical protein
MTKDDFDFDTWYDNVVSMVLDATGIQFRDPSSVRSDYEDGKNCADVAQSIIAEYSCED